MPKIQAATVAEHRAAQRVALLDAARAELSEHPGEAPGLAQVAQRAGLARSSVYSYFKSRDDLLDALILDTYPRWNSYVDEVMAQASSPAERVLAYVRANVHLVARGDHALVRVLARQVRGREHLAESTAAFHRDLQLPLNESLTELGVSDPQRIGSIIQSMVFAVSQQIEQGLPESEGVALLTGMLEPFLTSH